MNPVKFIVFLVLLYLVYAWFVVPWLGVTALIPAILVGVVILATVRKFTKFDWAFPWNLQGKWIIVLAVVAVVLGGFVTTTTLTTLGASIMPGETIVAPVMPVTPTPDALLGCIEDVRAINPDNVGESATISLNAWDLESNTPYSGAVNTTCWLYKNGNSATDYVKIITDTDTEEETGFAMGDTIYIYCGDTSYYTDPLEGYCIKEERPTINLNSHAIVAESNMQITGYDDTGGTALSAGTSTQEDYYVTMGADEEQSVYLKLKNNVANKAYDHCAWGTVVMGNLSSFKPASGYTKVETPDSMSNIAVAVNETGSIAVTSSYLMYKRNEGIMRLHEWQSIKPEFVIKSGTNDPLQTDNNDDANPSLAIAISMDCQYAKGTDGVPYRDFYAHTSSEADVGLAETETSPLGKQVGVIIEAR